MCVFLSLQEDKRLKNALKIKKPQERLRVLTLICAAKKKCGDEEGKGCGNAQPKITCSGLKLFAEFPADEETQGGKQTLEASRVLTILKKMTDKDIVRLGFNVKWAKPEWMICAALPVPPPAVSV